MGQQGRIVADQARGLSFRRACLKGSYSKVRKRWHGMTRPPPNKQKLTAFASPLQIPSAIEERRREILARLDAATQDATMVNMQTNMGAEKAMMTGDPNGDGLRPKLATFFGPNATHNARFHAAAAPDMRFLLDINKTLFSLGDANAQCVDRVADHAIEAMNELHAEIKHLRAALKPFAHYSHSSVLHYPKNVGFGLGIGTDHEARIQISDYIRAAAFHIIEEAPAS